jgi:hypothetical protein
MRLPRALQALAMTKERLILRGGIVLCPSGGKGFPAASKEEAMRLPHTFQALAMTVRVAQWNSSSTLL